VIRPAVDVAEASLAETERWVEEKSARLAAYPIRIKGECQGLLAQS
jgi:hypothetical protein